MYCEKSLNHFTLDHRLRRFCIEVMTSKYFDKIIIFLITVNSVILGLVDYTYERKSGQDPTKEPWINKLAEQSEIFFTIAFTIEVMIKIISMGFIFGRSSFLRDPWNWLDFSVVITSLAQKIFSNMQVLRTFRLFRPLKSLSNVPSMKLMVSTLFNSLSQLSYILILDNYFIMIFAFFGHALWQEVMHYRCRQTPTPVDGDWKVVEGDNKVCNGFHTCDIACGSLFNLFMPDAQGTMKQFTLRKDIP